MTATRMTLDSGGNVLPLRDRVLTSLHRIMLVDFAVCVGLVCGCLVIGLHNLSQSGPQLLEDGPRYANNGAMVHDWLLLGDYLHPVEFAHTNYVRYPAHSIPYHPPGYAVMLGLWFTVFGLSYASARAFVAFCLGLAVCFF